jgi:hypothetical protein
LVAALFDEGAVYVKDTTCPALTDEASVNSTVLPLTATAVTLLDEPATVTTNEVVKAVVDPRDSSYVRTTFVLSPLTAADWNTGATSSNVDALVTTTALELKLAASLPAVSWIALFVAAKSEVGAVYATVTVSAR